MRYKQFWNCALLLLLLYSVLGYGSRTIGLTQPPQPSTCVETTFSKVGNEHWSTVTLRLKNNCGQIIDLQNVHVTFKNATNLNTSFWGNFGPITYPDNPLQITSQADAGSFLASFSLHIPEEPWANSKLAAGQSITISYGTESPGYDGTSAKVYLSGTTPPPQTGEIELRNTTAKPADIAQGYAVIDIKNNGQTIRSVQVPWQGIQNVTGLLPGTYLLQPLTLTGANNTSYQGSANPSNINLLAGQKIISTIAYAPIVVTGKINIRNQVLPSELTGYTNNPQVTVTQSDTGSSLVKSVPWNTVTLVDQLTNNKSFSFSTPDIVFNGYRCTGKFLPTSATSQNTSPPTVDLSYSCVSIAQVNVGLNVTGLNSSTSSVNVTFTPSSGAPINKAVNLVNGSGNGTVALTQGAVYNVSASNVIGYSANFNPQPLTANANVVESVTYQQDTQPTGGGRVITYIPGWKQPPSASDLKNAGYTHVMIAFGLFSTTTPGAIVPAFDTVTKSYIDSLHDAGIKVLLSLGGALSNLPNASVDFHQVLQMASSPQQFQTTFVQSLKGLMTQYGFDGFDIDIEHGLNGTGPFQNPTGDIAVLAAIINQMHNDVPGVLISLTPQTANIGATRNFDGTWANYSSLIMQTYQSLSWVGIQLYNTGCILGIDQVCYDPNATGTPNFSVAMAVDLLANWPATDSAGRPTGFQPYISHLRADQVVLGYPAPNAQGTGDGSPITPTSTIKRAIQCLKTAAGSTASCGTYLPPKAYGLIGGVFNWEVTYDQNNQYKFARDLKTCVTTGACN